MVSAHYRDFVRCGYSNMEYIQPLLTHMCVRPTRQAIDKSWRKCNVPEVYPQDSDQEYVEDLGVQYLSRWLKGVGVMGVDDKIEYTSKTSPAKKWRNKGCKTKDDAIKHPDFPKELWNVSKFVLCDMNPKVELLPIKQMVEDDKIRTTFNPECDFVIGQKIIFGPQNDALLAAFSESFIKYGFIKQFGGFDDLGKTLEKFEILEEGDAVGYDRFIALCGCYRVRRRLLANPYFYGNNFYCMVVWYSLNPNIVCPDGVVRQRKTGNISGSNNTTSDNSIAHLLIKFREILNLFKKVFDRRPTLDEILKNHYWAIFSDDCSGAHNISQYGITLGEFMKNKEETYAQFGLKLKPEQTEYSYIQGHIDRKHSFLGSYFYWDEILRVYIPYPRIDKIASSLKYIDHKSDNIEHEISKMVSLCILSAPEPELHRECSNYLNFLFDRYKRDPLNSEIPEEWEQRARNFLKTPRAWFLYAIGRETYIKDEPRLIF